MESRLNSVWHKSKQRRPTQSPNADVTRRLLQVRTNAVGAFVDLGVAGSIPVGRPIFDYGGGIRFLGSGVRRRRIPTDLSTIGIRVGING